MKKIAVINPGFVSDCLETLEEIAGQAAESFHHNGGEQFAHIPCLNDSPEGMAVLNHVVRPRAGRLVVEQRHSTRSDQMVWILELSPRIAT